MRKKLLIIIATILFIISCSKNSNEVNKNEQKPDDLTNVENSLFNSDLSNDEETSFDDEELPFKPDLTGLDSLRGLYDAVINTDCDYFDGHWNIAGRFSKGQGIVIKEGFNESSGFDVLIEVQTADDSIKGYVFEKYITNFNGVNYDFWFKNVLMTRSYYYTEPIEYIFNDYEKNRFGDIRGKKESLMQWRHFYSEDRVRFSDNYFVIGNDEYTLAFRLEEIIHKTDTKDSSTYIIKLLRTHGEKQEITLVDNGNSITITESDIGGGNLLLYTYVPYNKKKSEKTAKAVDAWCAEQIEKL